ncbi:MAG TPA: alcohol dehydrogenase catalytic domain-containing protein [Acidimicrobiia bacterium]|nr:alcohol dehydrogenase catalytic domain-containing protein [Acidimicrobiia bacterium]
MKALVLNAPGEAELTTVPDPDPGPRALIQVERVGVCGTDASIFRGKIPVPYPLIMGHEASGVVRQPGSRGLVTAGTRVLLDPSISCGYCDLCRADRPNLCRNGGLLGRDLDGVFAGLLAVDETLLHPVPAAVSPEDAPLLQVLGTCVHAQTGFGVFPGQVAVVVGLGVTGLLHLQLLRSRGVRSIVAVTRSEWKQELATRLGATVAVGPEQAAETVADLSEGRGADISIECAGYEATLAQAIELTGAGGTLTLFGTLTGGGAGLPYYQLYHKELTLLNPRAALPRDYARAVALAASGTIELAPLVTHRLTLAEAPGTLAGLISDPATLKILFEIG